MVQSWYDAGVRLGGSAPAATTVTASPSVGGGPGNWREGSNIYDRRSTPPWAFQSRASLSSDPVFTDLRALASAQNPVIGYFDPLDLSSSDFTGEVSAKD